MSVMESQIRFAALCSQTVDGIAHVVVVSGIGVVVVFVDGDKKVDDVVPVLVPVRCLPPPS